MVKLIDILKEVLKEMGDSNKTYPFRLIKDDVKSKNDDGLHDGGGLDYHFKTKDDIKYRVEFEYTIFDPEQEDEEHQGVELGFGTDKSFDSTNKFDVSSIMQTIVAITKDAKKKYDFDYIAYSPIAHDDDYNSDEKKKLQKDKLYKYYIQKEYPGAEFIGQSGGSIFVKLPS